MSALIFACRIESESEVFLLESVQGLQSVKAVDRSCVAEEGANGGNGGFIFSFVKETKGGVTMPAVRVREKGDEFGGGSATEFWEGGLFEIVGDDAIDAAAIVATVKVEVLLDVRGE